MTKKIVVEKGESKRTTLDVRKGKPIVRIEDDIVVVEQGLPPKKRYKTPIADKMTQEEIEQLPSSRTEAIRLESKYYFTGKACKKGHITIRRVVTAGCCECERLGSEVHRNKRYRDNGNKWVQYGLKLSVDDLLKNHADRLIANKGETTVIDRIEAARNGLMYYYDPEPCQSGHTNKQRATRTGTCCVCIKLRNKENRERKYKRDVVVDNENLMKNPTISVEDK